MEIEKQLWKAAGKRLAAARLNAGYVSQKALADAVGLSEPAIAKYEQGVREIPLTLLHWLSEQQSINVHWIITGDGDMLGKISGQLPEVDRRFVHIKQFNVEAAAGSGLVPIDEDDEPEEVVLARSFMRRIGASAEQSQIIFARGESMIPTIPDGSLLLIDRSKTDIDDNGVFVFRVGEGIKVKRARWRADNQRIDLVSDNQLGGYPPETYTREEIAMIVPIGRVMCIMRTP
jgi:transcriptional regulator with XRE-family HTH domain